jgi:hypothetical protein
MAGTITPAEVRTISDVATLAMLVEGGHDPIDLLPDIDPALLAEIVRQKVAAVRRKRDSMIAHTVAPSEVRAVRVAEGTARERLERLGATMFPGVDGRLVAWEDATIEDHQARIATLNAHIAGLEHTREQHEAAIAAIRGSSGASCIREIMEAKR